MNDKITIVVVDDHKLVREMWKLIFAENKNIEVIGESGLFDEAIEMIASLRPNIVLLDINLPPESGMDAVPLIRKTVPGTKIIAVSMHNQTSYARKMLKLGAKAYVTKNSSRQEILNAIEEVMKGGVYICAEIKDSLTKHVFSEQAGFSNTKDLTIREMEIIKLLKEGLSSKEIADKLNISVRTAEVHRHNILRKLHLKNTVSLINYLNTTGLE